MATNKIITLSVLEHFRDKLDATIAKIDDSKDAATSLWSSTKTKTYVDGKITDLIGGAPEALDTLKELADALNDDASYAATITNALAGKVDKEDGKGLFSGAYADLTGKPTKLSDFTNDGGFISEDDIDGKITTAKSAIETAYKGADTALETAYKLADTTNLQTAKDYADAQDVTLKSTIESGYAAADAAALKSAKEYADGLNTTAASAYTDADAEILKQAKAYTDTREGAITTAYGNADTAVTSAAAADATSKANTAETNAKGYADGLDTAVRLDFAAADAKKISIPNAETTQSKILATNASGTLEWIDRTAAVNEYATNAEIDALFTTGDEVVGP